LGSWSWRAFFSVESECQVQPKSKSPRGQENKEQSNSLYPTKKHTLRCGSMIRNIVVAAMAKMFLMIAREATGIINKTKRNFRQARVFLSYVMFFFLRSGHLVVCLNTYDLGVESLFRRITLLYRVLSVWLLLCFSHRPTETYNIRPT